MNRKKTRKKNIILRCTSDLFCPMAIVFGCYVILHGNISPGGGFQGGVLTSGIVLLVYLGYGSEGIRERFSVHFLHSSETVAEILYVFVALYGILAGSVFCFNYILGDKMETSVLMNHAVGYHVTAGISFLLITMLSTLDEKDDKKKKKSASADNEEGQE